MDDYQNEAMPVGAAEVAAATQTLQRYKAGKAALDRRLVDNELWFRMGRAFLQGRQRVLPLRYHGGNGGRASETAVKGLSYLDQRLS